MAEPVKLNIGCGSRVLDGWINIDLVSRETTKKVKKEPDVISDIRKIPLEDDYADEAMAIHVLEHFHPWEVTPLMKEWIRLLKPGGKLVIEVPDIEKVAAYIVSGIRKPSYTTWPLYGDPSYMDPLMCHKWGYTVDSLKELMKSVGLVNVAREAAQYHFKEERDMRMVGYK